VRTPQGVWLIDLLSRTGARLNGQSLRCALMNKGDRFQLGPYVLRIWYPDVRPETPLRSIVAIPAGAPSAAADTPDSAKRPFDAQGTLGRTAAEVSVLVSTLRAELNQARERQQAIEALGRQLARIPVLEAQGAEVAGLQVRLRDAGAEAEGLQARL